MDMVAGAVLDGVNWAIRKLAASGQSVVSVCVVLGDRNVWVARRCDPSKIPIVEPENYTLQGSINLTERVGEVALTVASAAVEGEPVVLFVISDEDFRQTAPPLPFRVSGINMMQGQALSPFNYDLALSQVRQAVAPQAGFND
jgi:hypothetical protein